MTNTAVFAILVTLATATASASASASAAPLYQILLNDPVHGATAQSGPDPLTYGNGLVGGSASPQLLTSFAQRTPTTPISPEISLFGSGAVFNTIDLSALGPLVDSVHIALQGHFRRHR